MARASLSSHRLKSPAWRYGHTRPGNQAAKRRNLGVEGKKPVFSLTTLPILRFMPPMVMYLKVHSVPGYRICWPFAISIPAIDKSRLGRGSELRPFYMGTWGRGSQWCNRLLWIDMILRSRFFVWERDSEKGREVMGPG
jgi:hypothetical protein